MGAYVAYTDGSKSLCVAECPGPSTAAVVPLARLDWDGQSGGVFTFGAGSACTLLAQIRGGTATVWSGLTGRVVASRGVGGGRLLAFTNQAMAWEDGGSIWVAPTFGGAEAACVGAAADVASLHFVRMQLVLLRRDGQWVGLVGLSGIARPGSLVAIQHDLCPGRPAQATALLYRRGERTEHSVDVARKAAAATPRAEGTDVGVATTNGGRLEWVAAAEGARALALVSLDPARLAAGEAGALAKTQLGWPAKLAGEVPVAAKAQLARADGYTAVLHTTWSAQTGAESQHLTAYMGGTAKTVGVDTASPITGLLSTHHPKTCFAARRDGKGTLLSIF